MAPMAMHGQSFTEEWLERWEAPRRKLLLSYQPSHYVPAHPPVPSCLHFCPAHGAAPNSSLPSLRKLPWRECCLKNRFGFQHWAEISLRFLNLFHSDPGWSTQLQRVLWDRNAIKSGKPKITFFPSFLTASTHSGHREEGRGVLWLSKRTMSVRPWRSGLQHLV